MPAPSTVDVSGSVSQLSGSCPTLQFVVGGKGVQTSAATTWSGGNCNDVKNKTKVTVSGTLLVSGVIAASSVAIQN